MITLKQIRERLETIKNTRHDNEMAHAMEDDLHTDVLKAIAEGALAPDLLAAAALQTQAIEFDRWCA